MRRGKFFAHHVKMLTLQKKAPAQIISKSAEATKKVIIIDRKNDLRVDYQMQFFKRRNFSEDKEALLCHGS